MPTFSLHAANGPRQNCVRKSQAETFSITVEGKENVENAVWPSCVLTLNVLQTQKSCTRVQTLLLFPAPFCLFVGQKLWVQRRKNIAKHACACQCVNICGHGFMRMLVCVRMLAGWSVIYGGCDSLWGRLQLRSSFVFPAHSARTAVTRQADLLYD